MARYRFHCTNGYECLFDTTGAELRLPASLTSRAEQVDRDKLAELATNHRREVSGHGGDTAGQLVEP